MLGDEDFWREVNELLQSLFNVQTRRLTLIHTELQCSLYRMHR